MVTKITKFVKRNQAEIALVLATILIALLSFSCGYISAKNDAKQEIKIEKSNL
jgi:hypothetical protein